MTDADRKLACDYFPAFRDRDEAWWARFIAPDFDASTRPLPAPSRCGTPATQQKLVGVMTGGAGGFDLADHRIPSVRLDRPGGGMAV